MLPPCLLLLPAADDVLIGRLVLLACSVTQGGFTPRRHGMASRRGLALPSSMGMIDGIHDRAARGGPPALPPASTRLTFGEQFVLHVAYLPNGGPALEVHQPHLAGGKAHMGVISLLGHQLGRSSGAANHLSARPRFQLYVMYEGPNRDSLQRQGVSWFDIRIGTGHYLVSRLEPEGGQDIAFLTILVMQQGDTGAAVGIIFYGRYLGGDVILVPLEVDDTIPAFYPSALMAGGDLSFAPSRLVVHGGQKGFLGLLLGNLREIGYGGEPPPR